MIDLEELRKLLATMSIPSTESKLIFSELEKRGFWIGCLKDCPDISVCPYKCS
jgi:hypothetical protein